MDSVVAFVVDVLHGQFPTSPTKEQEGRKEMFYLTTHSTHFILQLYGVRHMVKDHSDSERKPYDIK